MTVEPFRIRRRSTSVMAQFGSSMYYSVPESPPFSGRSASIESLRLRRAAWAGAALLVLGVIIAWSYCISDLQDTPWSVDVCSLSVSAQGLALVNGSGDLVLQIRFVPNVLDTFNNQLKPCKSTSDTGPAGSSSPELSANNTSCVEITTSEFYLQVKQKPPAESVDCYEVLWHVLHNDATPEHCVVWDNALWYGGAEMSKQTWPIKLNGSMDPLAYVPSDVYKHRDRFGGVMERYWLSSRGSYIYVAQEVPLYVGWKPSLLCLQAQFSPPYVKMPAMNASKRSFLHYDLCTSKDVRSAHAHAAKRFSKPKEVPATSIFRYPVWSTWALYKTDVNQAKVLNLAQDIISHGFNGSQIEIDDGWTMAYGDHDFDKNKFPNATHMVTTLHDMGFAVTLWVHPFSNYDSSAFQEGVLKGYFISIPGGQVPALTCWWNGVAATLDVTNPMALSWFEDSLQWLKKKYDIDSFKFDAGEMSYLPSQFATATHLPEPAAFGRAYAQFAGKFASSAEVRLGLRTQGESLFVRMIDRDSIWGYELGLKSIIPTVLTFSLLGYSYILPDMIGGNLYGSTNTSKSQLDRELYIRWLELVAFLPAMQFSIPPWHFDDEVEAIARNYTSLHTHFVAPLVLSLAATRSEDPIVRPMWWLAPFEPEALRSNSQFLLGDSVVVAPVLEPGVRKRDVFLPPGTWCTTTRTCFSGSVLLKDYSVMLNEVAYFQKN